MALNDTDEILAVKAAELYYEAGKTQDEIGLALSVSRWKVGRLLVAAREHGFVRIEIVHPSARRFSLERELCGFYDLTDAVVVPATDSEAEVQARVAQAAADYLTTLRPVPRSLGVSWGRTLNAVAARLRPGWAVGVNPVQINGSVSSTRQATAAADTAVVIARKAQGTATLLPSPAIFEQAATRRAIEADRSVQSVLEVARNASAYLFSAGVVDDSSVHVDSGYLTLDDVTSLAEKGAVGDVVGRFLTETGQVADEDLNDRTLGISLDELRAATTSIAVIAGTTKHRVAHAVVSSGLCTILITDEATANSLLGRNPSGHEINTMKE
ncbi:sugar-binding transcriptional regulator [Leifsonia poae]|uniref:sugar-binding transcriptional regulator n=1 Tax=Leifsonia poae TaxID=110933 RepID=UPI001CBF05FF|nr:sugar-binding domain-containing protein [Leifsonia poae]